MAVFQRIHANQIRRDFVYRGWVFGLVPVYVGPIDNDAPRVAVRNWVPEWTLDLGEGLFFAWCFLVEPGDALIPIPIKLTGRLDGRRLRDDPALFPEAA